MDSVGDRIRSVRRTWRWSQEQLAATLKVDQATISFWERDLIRPGGSALLALASLFRVRVEALEKGRDFRIPDCPAQAGPTRADRILPRSVSLPCRGGQPLMVVDLGDGSSRGSALDEALLSLSQGLLKNRRVWLVLE